MNKRFWEMDFLRGIAIIMMILFHFLWDLNYFYNYGVVLDSGFWKIFQILIATIFLGLVGVSVVVSKINKNAKFSKYLKGGLKVFLFGLVITLATRILFPDYYVIFGILHLIGVSIVLSYFFRKLKYWNLAFGVIFILIGLFLETHVFNFNWLLFLGIYSNTFTSFDYYPIFPWFGIVLIGMFVGKLLYERKGRKFNFIDLEGNYFIRFMSFLGKKSLIIYMLHQVVLYGLFFLVWRFF